MKIIKEFTATFKDKDMDGTDVCNKITVTMSDVSNDLYYSYTISCKFHRHDNPPINDTYMTLKYAEKHYNDLWNKYKKTDIIRKELEGRVKKNNPLPLINNSDLIGGVDDN